MRTAIDTNVISALWSLEPLASRMAAVLDDARGEGGLVICPPVYVELLAHPKADADLVDRFLAATGISLDFEMDEAVWREVGRGFREYAQRRRTTGGGVPKRLLVDFIVGAHALLRADRLLTLDATRYRQDFPSLQLFQG